MRTPTRGQSTAKGWRKYGTELGYSIVLDESYPAIRVIFLIDAETERSQARCAALMFYTSDAILIQKALAEYKINTYANIGSSSGYADPSFTKECGDLANFLFDLTEWNADLGHTPLIKEKVEAFKKWEGNKDGRTWNGAAAYCYAGTWVLKDAVERAASLDKNAIRGALASTKISEGPATILPYFPIEFDEKGQAKDANLILVQYQDRTRVTVWPDAVRAVEPVFPMPKWEDRLK